MVLKLFRHLFAILVFPFTVTVLIPIGVARRFSVAAELPTSSLEAVAAFGGGVCLLAGLGLFSACIYEFASRGKGTLAPWDPPRRLVVRGPYRYLRNPMISGVILILFGEALMLRSTPHLAWALLFTVLNLIFIPLLEEPQLEQRFGPDYHRYRTNVPRFLPRRRPWIQD